MPPSSRMDPSHPPVQQGLNNPNLSSQPGQQLHHRNSAPPQTRPPMGQSGSGGQAHGGDLAFNPGPGMPGQPGMPGAGEGAEPSLDVSIATPSSRIHLSFLLPGRQSASAFPAFPASPSCETTKLLLGRTGESSPSPPGPPF